MCGQRSSEPWEITVTTTIHGPKQGIELLVQCFLSGVYFFQAIVDLMAGHRLILDMLCQHYQGAFLPVKEGDLLLSDPHPTLHEELNLTCQSLVFQDPSLEELYLF